MKKRKVRRRRVYAWFWYDIEGSSAWGSDGSDIPVCVTWGAEYAKPNPKDRMPFWRIVSSYIEDECGGETKIPDVMLKSRKFIGWSEVPWRG